MSDIATNYARCYKSLKLPIGSIKHIFEEGELEEEVVCRNFRHTTWRGPIGNKRHTFNFGGHIILEG